ncbi:hypothetical protein GGR53DRAFT_410235 [Hypoxylon sp. FL1150]|nr:hypothetical protein GGR53DRAFT_410235 [Hypoxylon sp. FL1150]
MAGIVPSTGFFPTLKRTACDRCRKSKLRCPSRQSDSEPCERCVRAKVECFTGYTQPLGRVGGDRSNGQMREQQWEPPNSPALAQPKSVSTVVPSPPVDMNGLYEVPREEDFWPTPPREEPETWNDIFGISLQGNTEQEALNHAFHSTISGDQTGGFHFHDSVMPFPAEMNPSTFSPDTTQDIPPLATPNHTPYATHNVDDTLSAAERDLQLSRLDADLCRQIRDCVAAADKTQIESPSANSNAVGKALSSTQQYSTILQSLTLTDSDLSSARPGAQSSPMGDPKPHMRLASILQILLLYFHILTLFDCLIFKLYQQLSGCTNLSSEPDVQNLPEMQFGGFQVQHHGFQVRILIQTVQHQIKLLEDTLGLPVDLRVTKYHPADNAPKGLLAGDSVRSLLQAIAIQQSGEYGIQEAYVNDRSSALLGTSDSLRGNMVKLQRFSDMDVVI